MLTSVHTWRLVASIAANAAGGFLFLLRPGRRSLSLERPQERRKPILRLFRGPVAALILATAGLAALPAAALALDIYEPDSYYAAPPNALLASLPKQEAQAPAQVNTGGAELVVRNPRFANAVVTSEKGKLRADVYLKLDRVIRLRADDGAAAQAIAEALNRAQAAGQLRADRIRPGRQNGLYTLMAGNETLVVITPKLAASQNAKPATLALRWMDDLRKALGGAPAVHTASRGAIPLGRAVTRVGHASWYGPGFHGRRAADGSRFNQHAMTAAHKTLPFGTMLLVTNLRSKKSCIVRVTDRGPYIPGRMLDLSMAAAESIGIRSSGVGTVRIDVLK